MNMAQHEAMKWRDMAAYGVTCRNERSRPAADDDPYC